MSKLEEQYKNNIGRLFVYNEKRWGDYVKSLVMIEKVEKSGGWFFYHMEIVKYNLDDIPDVRMGSNRRMVSCRDFLRNSTSPLSLLGDTSEKEVA